MKDRYLEGLVAGDHSIIREIYSNYLGTAIAWTTRNGGDRSDALDIFQEGLTQILIRAKKGEIKLESNFGAYLLGTCKFLWLGKLRKDKQHQKVRSELDISHSYEEQESFFNSDEISIGAFLERNRIRLSEVCRKVLLLISKNVSPSDIAQQLEMSNANTVYRRKFACMKKWREYIEEDPLYQEWKVSQYGN